MCIYVIICDKKPISATSHLIEVFLVSHQSIAISLVSFRQLWLLWFVRFHPSRHDRFCYQTSVVANNLCSYGSLSSFLWVTPDTAPLLPAVLPFCDAAASSLRRSLFSTALHPPDTVPSCDAPPLPAPPFLSSPIQALVPPAASCWLALRRSHDARSWPPRSLTSVLICFARS